MCGEGVCSILLLPLVARCLDIIAHVCCVAAVVKVSVFTLGVLEVCLCKGCDGCCVIWEVWVSSVMYKLYVFVLCVSCGSSQFFMTCTLLMLDGMDVVLSVYIVYEKYDCFSSSRCFCFVYILW